MVALCALRSARLRSGVKGRTLADVALTVNLGEETKLVLDVFGLLCAVVNARDAAKGVAVVFTGLVTGTQVVHILANLDGTLVGPLLLDDTLTVRRS